LKYANSKQKTKSSVDNVEKINGSLATKDADKVEVICTGDYKLIIVF
jgi:hypothetical protein